MYAHERHPHEGWEPSFRLLSHPPAVPLATYPVPPCPSAPPEPRVLLVRFVLSLPFLVRHSPARNMSTEPHTIELSTDAQYLGRVL